jgi:hypothetical protein
MAVAARVADEYIRLKAHALFVDEGGVGGGVVDRLRQLRLPVIGVNFGGRPDRHGLEDDHALYYNKRSEIWGALRSWLTVGGIPDDKDLKEQLCAPQYGFNAKGEITLERKEDMEKRGAQSPDIADALALTFAHPVMSLTQARPTRGIHQIDYDPFAEARQLVR